MTETTRVRQIAFVGDHLPRKCGIATFTSDLLAAVDQAFPRSQCLSVAVNDIEGGYEYSDVVRFEIEEQDLSSYLRAADFVNINNPIARTAAVASPSAIFARSTLNFLPKISDLPR